VPCSSMLAGRVDLQRASKVRGSLREVCLQVLLVEIKPDQAHVCHDYPRRVASDAWQARAHTRPGVGALCHRALEAVVAVLEIVTVPMARAVDHAVDLADANPLSLRLATPAPHA